MNAYKKKETSMYNFRIWLKGDASVHHGSYVAWCIKEGWRILSATYSAGAQSTPVGASRCALKRGGSVPYTMEDHKSSAPMRLTHIRKDALIAW